MLHSCGALHSVHACTPTEHCGAGFACRLWRRAGSLPPWLLRKPSRWAGRGVAGGVRALPPALCVRAQTAASAPTTPAWPQVAQAVMENVGGAMAAGGEGLKAASQRIEVKGGGGSPGEGAGRDAGGKSEREGEGAPRSRL